MHDFLSIEWPGIGYVPLLKDILIIYGIFLFIGYLPLIVLSVIVSIRLCAKLFLLINVMSPILLWLYTFKMIIQRKSIDEAFKEIQEEAGIGVSKDGL